MRRILVSTAVVAATLALAGCSVGGASSQSDTDAGYSQSQSVEESAASDSAADNSAAGALESTREVITTGYATITVESPADAASDAARIVETAGGRVDARTEYAPTDGDAGSASLTLRVPSAKLNATIETLKELGEVEEISLSTEDVTTEVQDLDARITALRSSVNRLTDLLATAKDTKVLIELETAITERQGDLESMEAQQRYYADQVSMSTIDLRFVSEADAPIDTPDTFVSGLGTGWDSFVAFISGLLVVVGVLIPWLIFVGVLALVLWFFIRRAIRRSSARSATAPATPAVANDHNVDAP